MRKENLVEKLAPPNQDKKIGKEGGGRAGQSVKNKKEKGKGSVKEKGVISFTDAMVASIQPVAATQPIQAVANSDIKPTKTRPTRTSGGQYSEKQVLI